MTLRGLCVITAALYLVAPGLVASESAPDTVAAARASQALMEALRLDTPTIKEVTDLLADEDFIGFEHRIQRYEREFASNPLSESPLYKLYSVIDGGNAGIQKSLDKWVKTRPSYISFAARGTYETNLGYRQRGTRNIESTSPEVIAQMEATMAAARDDLERALALNPKFVPAYIALLQVAQAVAGPDAATAIERRATREVPDTYYVRQMYLRTLRPRWGGSYEAMQAYEGKLDDAAKLNPRIWSLKGESWGERGYTAQADGDTAGAIRYYTRALLYGDRLEFLKARGTQYFAARQYDLALKDFNRYREYYARDDQIDRYAECSEALRNGRPCAVNPLIPSAEAR
jgi:tetratricopeptide (TPR) repeat protein